MKWLEVRGRFTQVAGLDAPGLVMQVAGFHDNDGIMTFQELILALDRFWSEHGCIRVQPYNSEVGAGTFNPNTFLRALGPEPWNVAYVEPSRRPADGRYGENPNRLQQFHQYQVILKPSPLEIQDLYVESLRAIGTDPMRHDIRFIEDDWESPTLGAWGLGWQVWLDGLEISQFTYFQQCGGIDCKPVSGELTYGLERIAMYLQDVDNVFDVEWTSGIRYGELYRRAEWEWSTYNFEKANPALHLELFDRYEKQTHALLGLEEKKGKGGKLRFAQEPLDRLVLPAYDCTIKCSHYFNILDARGAISVTERQGYIGRVRHLARACAESWLAQREAMGFPLLKRSRSAAE